ncbi:MAG: CPBP family intramembrane metalloprotease [Anaerolineaceae bacterium]|nr:CPBP family intramembrane metalloprotease [Anaerolineaceae bacterium]
MTSAPPSPSLKERLTRFRKIRPRLLLILTALALAAVLWVVLRSLTQSPHLSIEWRLFLLLIAALLSLWIGLGGVTFLLKQYGRSLADVLSISVILILAYLIPTLAFVIPDWINQSLSDPKTLLPGGLLGTAGLAAGQPWFYLWQTLVLAGSSLTRPSKLARAASDNAALHWQVTASLLTGLAAWLAGAFIYGLVSTPYPAEPSPPSAILQATLLGVSILIAPWAEEHFFRGEILPRWEASLGRTQAVLASAALFATLQLRPLLWLPAFVVGLMLAELALRTRRLIYPILAHALCNLLFFLLGWYLVI